MSSSSSSGGGAEPVDAAGRDVEIKLGVFWLARPGHSQQQPEPAAAASNPLIVSAAAGKTVRQLKEELETRIPGGPLAGGQTLIWRGRRLLDAEQLVDVVKEQQFGVGQPAQQDGSHAQITDNSHLPRMLRFRTVPIPNTTPSDRTGQP